MDNLDNMNIGLDSMMSLEDKQQHLDNLQMRQVDIGTFESSTSQIL